MKSDPESWWPWAEANQGLLTLIALALAIAFFLLEQRRANQAEQDSRDAARTQEAKDRDTAMKAEQRAVEAARDEERRLLGEFFLSADNLANELRQLIAEERAQIAGEGSNNVLWTASERSTYAARTLGGAFQALISNAPLDNGLIRGVLHLATLANDRGFVTFAATSTGAATYLDKIARDIKVARDALKSSFEFSVRYVSQRDWADS